MTSVVRLTPMELAIGHLVGNIRHARADEAGRPDAHGFTGTNGCTLHVSGACGELALAKHLGIYWSPGVNTWHAPDLGTTLQVRTRSKRDYDLIVRPSDDPAHRYALVIDETPNFIIAGWVDGHAARRKDFWANHASRPAAWFVPQAALSTEWAWAAAFSPRESVERI